MTAGRSAPAARFAFLETHGDRTRATCSVGMIATRPDEVAAARAALDAAGFGSLEVLTLIVRNYDANHCDGYSGLRLLLDHAAGDFLLAIHQDVRVVDDLKALRTRLAELAARDPRWAVAGNAGFSRLDQLAIRISDPRSRDMRCGTLPAAVMALDENMLIFNLHDPVPPSADLSGFHFYGTDVCLQARRRRRRCYVIDWHVEHMSRGRQDASWFDALHALEAKYSWIFPFLIIRNTITVMFFGVFRPFGMVRTRSTRLLERALRLLRAVGLRHERSTERDLS